MARQESKQQQGNHCKLQGGREESDLGTQGLHMSLYTSMQTPACNL